MMELEVRLWLKNIIPDIDEFSITSLGNSEKGDGYIGDIIFVSLTSKVKKRYDLVLKCSKRSDALRKSFPVREAFLNEIYFYKQVLPSFTQFQLEKGIDNPFNSVPKCYGKFTSENMEVIVLENLKTNGYTLWDKKKPFTLDHIYMVVEEYAKFHSISMCLKQQQPQNFKNLVGGLHDVFTRFLETSDMDEMFGKNIDQLCDGLQGTLDSHIIENFRKLKDLVNYIFNDMIQEMDGLEVILHGDCWSNNFMFKYDGDKVVPSKIAILDWQISRCLSPILDLSYFIFAGISGEDLEHLDDVLEYYYKSIQIFSQRLGSDLDTIYTKKEFFNDWKKYSKYGILMATLVFKICVTEKDEVLDIADAADDGQEFTSVFSYDVKDKTGFINRAKNLVKYVVEKELLS